MAKTKTKEKKMKVRIQDGVRLYDREQRVEYGCDCVYVFKALPEIKGVEVAYVENVCYKHDPSHPDFGNKNYFDFE